MICASMILGEIMTEDIYLNNVFTKMINDVRYVKLKAFVVLPSSVNESKI